MCGKFKSWYIIYSNRHNKMYANYGVKFAADKWIINKTQSCLSNLDTEVANV